MCRVGGGCEDGSVVCWDTRTGLSLVAGEQHAEAVWGAVRRIAYIQYLHYISTISTTPQVTVLLLTVTALLCWSRGRPGDTKKRTNPRQ